MSLDENVEENSPDIWARYFHDLFLSITFDIKKSVERGLLTFLFKEFLNDWRNDRRINGSRLFKK